MSIIQQGLTSTYVNGFVRVVYLGDPLLHEVFGVVLQQQVSNKVSANVLHPTLNKLVHKRTLLSVYYNGKKLSNDRLVRIQNEGNPQLQDEIQFNIRHDTWYIRLHEDIAVGFRVDGRGKRLARQAWYGRVQRMRCKVGKGRWVEYRNPVKILTEDRTKMPNVWVQCHFYKVINSNNPRILSYNLPDLEFVHVNNVICPVTIKYDQQQKNIEAKARHHDVVSMYVKGHDVLPEDGW